MLKISVLDKKGKDISKFITSSLTHNEDETELKILIDGPAQSGEIKKILEPLGFSHFVYEDDDGLLFLVANKNVIKELKNEAPEIEEPKEISQPAAIIDEPEPIKNPPAPPEPSAPSENFVPQDSPAPTVSEPPVIKRAEVIKNSTGILISCEPGKVKRRFFQKVLASLVSSTIKPDVIALTDGAVRLAAYDSFTCDYLKELEAMDVKILISESCADLMGITEAVGAGVLTDMSEIFEELFTCEKVLSL